MNNSKKLEIYNLEVRPIKPKKLENLETKSHHSAHNAHFSSPTSHFSGITLVALVVTIVVLLILAGVTITALLGDDGIIKKAQNAADSTNLAVQNELSGMNSLTDKMNNIINGIGTGGDTSGGNTEDPGDETGEIMSAQDIASNPEDYYGRTVTNYECTNTSANSAVANWKIFYAGNEFSEDGNTYHVYLIADNYIPRANIPASTAGNRLNDGHSSYPYAAFFTNILNDYPTGSASIANNVKNLNKDFFTKGYGNTNTNNNMKSVAYMLDTNAWSVYAGEDAKYAIGGPSIEMLMKSYSQAHSVDYRAQATNCTGYQISNNGDSNWQYGIGSMLSTSDSLYVISSYSNAAGYWVASPSVNNAGNVMFVHYNGGNVGNTAYNDKNFRFAVSAP